MKPRILIGLAILALLLTGCGNKFTEQFHDAKRSGTNNGPAEVGTMPDGFSNWATKCDHGNRVYVAFHHDSPFAAIAVVPNDKSCSGVG